MSAENNKYCYACGKECIDVEINGFDIKTGKRKIEKHCPTRLCLHSGKGHGKTLKNKKGFSSLIEFFFFKEMHTCLDCGSQIDYYCPY